MKYLIILLLMGCSSVSYKKTVDNVDIPRFMGNWYVLAGRFTFLEKEVHNGLEIYKWNKKEKRIDISFDYRKGGFDGEKKSVPQKGWVYNKKTNAHWKVQPIWPLKLDYLIIDLAPDYSWVTVGVPNQNYVWIMARDWKNPEPIVKKAISNLKKLGYRSDEIVTVPHKW
jgi:apolipoprotein D and lipocalin family protein